MIHLKILTMVKFYVSYILPHFKNIRSPLSPLKNTSSCSPLVSDILEKGSFKGGKGVSWTCRLRGSQSSSAGMVPIPWWNKGRGGNGPTVATGGQLSYIIHVYLVDVFKNYWNEVYGVLFLLVIKLWNSVRIKWKWAVTCIIIANDFIQDLMKSPLDYFRLASGHLPLQ